MRNIIICSLLFLTSCAGGNYTLKGPNNAEPAPETLVYQTPESEESNLSKTIFPWVAWGSVIAICVFLLVKERWRTEEKTD